ncbi:hypothetical protein [Oceanobacillus sp. FSL H7-0719]|uniref:hypothetical protein n=1 Tax=Oceanobacillus sp. FSL H7-0719 TaxID=2954507 RepID=UPI0032546567
MEYTKEEYDIIKKMVKEFSLVHNNEKRRELVWWYSLASGIKKDDVVKQIMTELNAI